MDMFVYRYNSMISCAVLEKHALVSFLDSFLENCTSPENECNLNVFQKLMSACFSKLHAYYSP